VPSVSSAPDKDLTLAFAGVFQAATLVHQLAATENHDSGALHHAGVSLLRLDAGSAEAVFGSIQALRLGLHCVSRLFSGHADASAREVFQYAAGMHQLSAKLRRDCSARAVVAEGLNELRERHLQHAGDFDHDDALHHAAAALYVRTISRMTPRIMVRGSQGRLSDPLTVSRVRTALFAGIRAAWLWHQLGGRRWQVMVYRREYQRQAQRLLGRAFG